MRTVTLSLLLTLAALAGSVLTPRSSAQVDVGVSVSFAPPDLPVYDQPICPADGYIWTPGYWDWDGDDYFWVPGTWVLAPEPGLLWTPGYWAWRDTGFAFIVGYWAPVVGFYGGINYGFGYFGRGYEGGHWDHDHFFYNRTVNNVNVSVIHNTYNTTVVNNNGTRVSFNGGQGGVNAQATVEEQRAAGARHVPPVPAQTQHIQAARSDSRLRASANHGLPPVAATSKPGALRESGAAPAREAGALHSQTAASNGRDNNAPARPGSASAVHPSDLPRIERSTIPSTGNPKLDQKNQREQEKLAAQQEKERQKLQQQQDKEHQQTQKLQANDAKRQQMEQRHQQQTQQMAQRHEQQRQQMQNRQQPRPPQQSQQQRPSRPPGEN